MEWSYIFMTLIFISLVAVFIAALIFFRKIYFMFDEIDARMIQLRNIMEDLKVASHTPAKSS